MMNQEIRYKQTDNSNNTEKLNKWRDRVLNCKQKKN